MILDGLLISFCPLLIQLGVVFVMPSVHRIDIARHLSFTDLQEAVATTIIRVRIVCSLYDQLICLLKHGTSLQRQVSRLLDIASEQGCFIIGVVAPYIRTACFFIS
jgi:hypothetical protein